MKTNPTRTKAVLNLVLEERRAQEARYGVVNETIENGTGPEFQWLLPYTSNPATTIQEKLRLDYEIYEEKAGAPTWAHLVREELAEAFQEADRGRLAEELVQVAALCVSWLERLGIVGCEECEGDALRELCLNCLEAAL